MKQNERGIATPTLPQIGEIPRGDLIAPGIYLFVDLHSGRRYGA